MKELMFSVIVVSFNAGEKIKNTIDSILEQSYDNYEIIVKDGVSTDNTLKNIPADDKITVFSLRDNGIYDAMNFAIEQAKGKYVIFLNCGDCFENKNVLQSFSKYIQDQATETDVVFGDYIRQGSVFKQPDNITKFFLYRTPLCHQTMFIKRNLFEKYGYYDTNFKICADWCFTVKTFTNGIIYSHLPYIVCCYEGGGVSESEKGMKCKFEEIDKIRNLYYTDEEKRKYDRRIKFSFYKLRQELANDKTPKVIRELYLWLVSIYNKIGR